MGCFSDIVSSHPCCGCLKLSIATVIVAGIEIILSIAAIVVAAISMSTVNKYQTINDFKESGIAYLNLWDLEEENLDGIKHFLWIFFGVILFFSFLSLAVSLILLYAVRSRQITLIRVWILFTSATIVMGLVFLGTSIFLGTTTLSGVLLDVFSLGYSIYSLWIVWSFMVRKGF